MTSHDFEARLRSELHALDAAPTAGLRRRVLENLAERGAVPGDLTVDLDADPRAKVTGLLAWTAGLAAGLLALVAIRGASTSTLPSAESTNPRDAWTAEWNGSAAGLESGLLVQGDLLADDARRAAAGLLERMPAAPWTRRTDRR